MGKNLWKHAALMLLLWLWVVISAKADDKTSEINIPLSASEHKEFDNIYKSSGDSLTTNLYNSIADIAGILLEPKSSLHSYQLRVLRENEYSVEIEADSNFIENTDEVHSSNLPSNSTEQDGPNKGYFQKMIEGLSYSFLFIFLSEIGDKTFLFVVLYATRMNGLKLLLISSIGLWGMHVAATAVGNISQFIFSPFWLHWVTVASFLIIGVVLIYMGITEEAATEDFDEKLKGIEMEMLEKRSRVFSDEFEEELNKEEKDEEEGVVHKEKKHSGWLWTMIKCIIFNEAVRIIATIIWTEMADRSQISAVALAANYPFWIVALAGSFGHILALILAILFGKAVSDYTSEKCINIVGGILFLIFSAYSLIFY